MIKSKLLFVAIILALSGVGIGAYTLGRTENPIEAQQTIVETKTPELDANVIHELVNAERVKVGLQPLVRDTRLDASACEKMATITSSDKITHDGYETFINKHSPGSKHVGENLAQSNEGNNGVVLGWMASPGHRENILREDYLRVGYCTGALPFYHLRNANLTQVVQHFAN